MSRKRSIILFMALFLGGFSCTFIPVPSSFDRDAISTSAAQTVLASLTQNSMQVSFSATPTWTPGQPTITPSETPTETLSPTQTLTATMAFTSTPFITVISVSTPTNCRNGPGKVYDREGALLVGETAEVVGRDPTGNYWYIRNPDAETEFCWVWGKYATLTGPASLLPVLTPPPTPTPTFTPLPTFTSTPSPSFKVKYVGLDTCNGSWWAEVRLKNNGSVPFKSVNISVTDTTTSNVVVNIADGFVNLDGCLSKTTVDTLGLDAVYLLSAPAFLYDPTGHVLKSVITLCSETGQKGMCTTVKIDFTP